jgi:hypothetical protein
MITGDLEIGAAAADFMAKIGRKGARKGALTSHAKRAAQRAELERLRAENERLKQQLAKRRKK